MSQVLTQQKYSFTLDPFYQCNIIEATLTDSGNMYLLSGINGVSSAAMKLDASDFSIQWAVSDSRIWTRIGVNPNESKV